MQDPQHLGGWTQQQPSGGRLGRCSGTWRRLGCSGSLRRCASTGECLWATRPEAVRVS
jgi:hypothetical protein